MAPPHTMHLWSVRWEQLSLALRACLLFLVLLTSPLAQADRVLVLVNNSTSMLVHDADRLVPAAMLDFASSLPANSEIAVIAFDETARLVAPFGHADALTLSTLGAIDYQGQYTDPSRAVERALYELRDRPPPNPGHNVIVLITDSLTNLGHADATLRAEDWLLGQLREELIAMAVSVWAVGLTEAADFRLLSRLTEATNGNYYRAATAAEVTFGLENISTRLRGSSLSLPTTTGAHLTPAATIPKPGNAVSGAPLAPPKTPADITSVTPASAPDTGLDWWPILGFISLVLTLAYWGRLLLRRVHGSRQSGRKFAAEYFPNCYLVDLYGVTNQPTHPLSSKYNMITRLQKPPEDSLNYIQMFRRQVGRRHALIEYHDLSFWIIDQDSLNGTFLNGKRISAETRLKHGDRLRFHTYEFEFCVSDLALSNETVLAQHSEPSS